MCSGLNFENLLKNKYSGFIIKKCFTSVANYEQDLLLTALTNNIDKIVDKNLRNEWLKMK